MPKLKPGTIYPTQEEDAAINAGIAADPDSPEWTAEDFAQAKPASQVLPPEIYMALVSGRPRGRPKAEETKVFTAIRLDADILEAFKSDGKGWQTRINEALQEQLSITTCLDERAGVHARFPAPDETTTARTSDEALEAILKNLRKQHMILIHPVASSHLIVKGRIVLADGHSMWVFRTTMRIQPPSENERNVDRRDILQVLVAKGLNCTWVS